MTGRASARDRSGNVDGGRTATANAYVYMYVCMRPVAVGCALVRGGDIRRDAADGETFRGARNLRPNTRWFRGRSVGAPPLTENVFVILRRRRRSSSGRWARDRFPPGRPQTNRLRDFERRTIVTRAAQGAFCFVFYYFFSSVHVRFRTAGRVKQNRKSLTCLGGGRGVSGSSVTYSNL